MISLLNGHVTRHSAYSGTQDRAMIRDNGFAKLSEYLNSFRVYCFNNFPIQSVAAY